MITGIGTELILEDMLVDYINGWINNVVLPYRVVETDPSYSEAESQIGYRTPMVWAGMLPKFEVGIVDVNQIPQFPFILCHIFKGRDAAPEGCIYTRLVFGCWDNNPLRQGYRDMLQIMRSVTRKIWYVDTIARNWQLNRDDGTDWRIYDDNEVTWPYFIGECIFGWRVRTPISAAESEGLDEDLDSALSAQPTILAEDPLLTNPNTTTVKFPIGS